jgi:hypothetical protein
MDWCPVGPGTFEGWQRWYFVNKLNFEPQRQQQQFIPPAVFAATGHEDTATIRYVSEEGWAYFTSF